jgi:hypothetical protein
MSTSTSTNEEGHQRATPGREQNEGQHQGFWSSDFWFFSLHVFSPLYQQRGLLASIAAHFAWSLGVLVSFQQLCARIFVRAVKSFRNWVRPRHEKPSQQ